VIVADRWYDSHPDLEIYFQGDILSGIPFPTLPTFLPAAKQESWAILRPRLRRQGEENRPDGKILKTLPNELVGRAAKDVPDVWSRPNEEGEFVITQCNKIHVAVVSRSCDIDKASRKHFLIAPVFHVRDLVPEQRTAEKLRDLRANGIMHWFYLPEKPQTFPESFVDLSQMTALHRTFFGVDLLRANLVARLSAEGTTAFQQSLSLFYGVEFGFSHKDVCRQAGRYSCASCFFSHRNQHHVQDFAAGTAFGACPHCREDAMWVKVPPQPQPRA
jgi:hypothetical protein